MLEASFPIQVQDGACLFEKQALYWWCRGELEFLVGSRFADSMPSPHLV